MSEERSTSEGRWTRARALFEEAAELPPQERERFLREECDDDRVRAEVKRYLAADASQGGMLDAGVSEAVRGLLEAEDPAQPGGAASAGDRLRDEEEQHAGDKGSEANGSLVGPYRLGEVLGEGGMGTVYRAMQIEPVRREVALKIIKPGMDTREVVQRFESERQVLALMDHTSIARVFDAGTTEAGRPYFVMELVKGVPLDEYCDTHRLATADRLALFARVCDAVHHAHQKGVIHRDLKPSNVLVTVEDAKPVPKIIDFGIAKAVALSRPQNGLATRMGQMLGTPAYMSPEQAERSALDVDTRTDVYSLGVMLYELLSGSLPYDREIFGRPDFIVQHLLRQEDVPTPSVRLGSLADTQQTVVRNRKTDVRTLRRELRGDLDWIVMRAMEKDRTRRYGAASELAADVRRYVAGEPVSARPPSFSYRTRKFARRHRGVLATAAALMVSVIGGTVAATVGFVRASESAAEARAERARAEAVTDFLDGMLRAADPVSGDGAATTVRDVLAAAAGRVSTGALAGQPLVEIAVRRSIGGTYMHLGMAEEASEHLDAAVAMMTATPGVDVIELVEGLDELGQVRRRQGELAAAERVYRRALELADSGGLTDDSGAGEHTVNAVRNDLGLLLRDADRMDEAAELLEALAASQATLPDVERLDRATTLNNLSLVRRARGDIDGAITGFQETLELLRDEFGDEHVYVASVLESIGSLEARVGRYAEADSLMGEALAIRRRLLPERHPDIVNGLNGLGLLHTEAEDYEKAERYLGEALQMSLEVHGEGHPRTAQVLNNLGLLHLALEDFAAAETAFRRSVRIREATLGATHRNTLNARGNLAAALLRGGAPEEAEAVASEIVRTQRETGLNDVVMVGSATRTWGSALRELGRYPEAEEHLTTAFEMQQRELGEAHRHTQSTVRALVELYDAWGREESAAAWRRRFIGS